MGFYQMLMEEEQADDEVVVIAQALTVCAEASSRRCRRRRHPDAAPRRVIERRREEGASNIRRDYFGRCPIFTDEIFRRRHRMPRPLFEKIHDKLVEKYDYFKHLPDATGRYGHTGMQKMVASLTILAYGCTADIVDNYVRIAESTAREAVHRFCTGIIEQFGEQYLRAPTDGDIQRILAFNAARGFPGMLGAIDCMHWKWKNCPASYKGMYTGRGKSPTMILEAVATHDLWIWHAYFGLPGSLNDINVVHRSTVFHNFLHGRYPKVNFTVNGHTYDMGYYLADGIYPDWPAFVKSPGSTHDERSARFKKMQEAARKQIERAFGVLQSRWGIIRGPAYGWDRDDLSDIMTACIIMHNMIIETEGRELSMQNAFAVGPIPHADPTELHLSPERASFVQRKHALTNSGMHKRLTQDLIHHMWNFVGAREQQQDDG